MSVTTQNFPRPLNLVDLGNGKDWMHNSFFLYIHGPIYVPIHKGRVTDLTSTPRILWRVIPPTGKYNRAVVVHDHLYKSGACSRLAADFIFLLAMLDLGVPRWKAVVMFGGVRLFAFRAYRRNNGLRILSTLKKSPTDQLGLFVLVGLVVQQILNAHS